jgi:hypothetical protein
VALTYFQVYMCTDNWMFLLEVPQSPSQLFYIQEEEITGGECGPEGGVAGFQARSFTANSTLKEHSTLHLFKFPNQQECQSSNILYS